MRERGERREEEGKNTECDGEKKEGERTEGRKKRRKKEKGEKVSETGEKGREKGNHSPPSPKYTNTYIDVVATFQYFVAPIIRFQFIHHSNYTLHIK